MDVRDLTGRLAVVTGAGSGIGRATALACAARGASLAICDLDETRLSETAKSAEARGNRVFTRRVDVASAEEVTAFAEEVHAEFEGVDLLVNNAGVALGATIDHMTVEDWDWILGINLSGVFYGCKAFVPHMIDRGRGGHVVNIASMAGYLPAPGLMGYNATKYGVIGLSESLRLEVSHAGIGVTAICPGIINTPILSSARMRGLQDRPELRERAIEGFARRNYTPERVARNILKAVQRNRAVAPVSLEAWIGWYLRRWLPGLSLALLQMMSDRQRKELEALEAGE